MKPEPEKILPSNRSYAVARELTSVVMVIKLWSDGIVLLGVTQR
jgi:hypothetical protein